jgi:hypothetical protein
MTGTRRRTALIVLAALAALAVAVAVTARPIVGRIARDRIVAELDQRGIAATIGSVTVGLGGATVAELCVDDPEGGPRLACAERVAVTWDPGALRRRELVPTGVTASGVRVFLAAEHGSLDDRRARWERALRGTERPTPGDAEASARPRAERPSLDIVVSDVEVDVAGQPLPLDGIRIERATVHTGAETTIDAHFAMVGARLPAPLEGDVPSAWDVAARLGRDGLEQVQLHPTGALVVRAPALAPGARLELDGAGFSAPYHLTAFGVRVWLEEAAAPHLAWATGTLALRELTTRLEDLYFSSLELGGLEVRVPVDRATGQIALAMLRSEEGSGPGATTEGAEPAEELDAGTEGSGVAPGDADPWAGRVWWERIPQRITIDGASVEVMDAGAGATLLAVRELSVRYALRIFNMQLDASVQGRLEGPAGDAGTVDLDAVWLWERERLDLTADLDGIDVAAVLGALAPSLGDARGTLDVALRIDQDAEGPGLRSSGTVAASDLLLPLPLLQQPLRLASVGWEWDASRSEEVEPVALRFERSEVRIGDATVSVRPTIHGLRWARTPPLTQLDVEIDVPDQSAQALLEAVPSELLGPLAGTRLAGDFGFRVAWSTFFERDAERRVSVRIDPPTVLELRDDGMRIEALPDAVDVRRMLDGFVFTFRGPDDRLNRTIRVPPPASGAETEESAPLDAHPWARLDAISWYLIATQLYREDGRFFENGGVNWYQLRRVLEEAWADGELGRGASTITMQLVKNVFLSHERSIERKLQELFLTYWVTRLVPKERILEVYLNVIEWGPGINGVVEAAWHYFETTPDALTLGEAVWLSAITPAPARRSAQRAMGTPPDWMRRHSGDLMRGLADRGWINESELAAGLAETVRFAGTRDAAPEAAMVAEGSGAAELDATETETPPAPSADASVLAALPHGERLPMLVTRATARRPSR